MPVAASQDFLRGGWLQFYIDPRGRATRRDYNIRGLIVVLVGMMITSWLDTVLFTDGRAVLSDIWSYVATLLTVAVTSRRLHDLNWSGWWQVPFQGVILAATFATNTSHMVLNTPDDAIAVLDRVSNINSGVYMEVLGAGASLILFFGVLSLAHGSKGPNKYGTDPLVANGKA